MTNTEPEARNPKPLARRVPILFSVLALLASLAVPSFAVFTKIGMAGLPFLKIGVGRCAGMGGAFVAVADDATAAFWNPAGLALLQKRSAVVNHIDWVADINHEYLSIVMPTKVGNFGVSVTALSLGGFEETTVDTFQGTGRTFTGSDLAAGVSYARMFTDKLCFGLTAKVVSEQVWDVGAAGAAFDFGVHYNTGWRNLRLAMAIVNFGPDLKYSGGLLDFTHEPGWSWPWSREPIPGTYLTETFPLPVTFRFGVAYDFFRNDNSYLTAAADLNHFNDVNEKVNVGFEYNHRPVSLRAGYILNTDFNYARDVGWTTGLSAGAGFRFTPVAGLGLNFDYNYRDLGRLGGSHRVTLSLDF
ncbi:PorV/PorQ family protein [candidate division WOR-3 bacterium]|uniref:PorV/PorQ family protein n=1 Tax=candidate division WOR-3 bacterium TaxID=2052148 RepID=A0A937XG44_UNCW3|nr:PorV/PorQ family protein [candidate division WOR-3 bacterium]